MEKLLTQAQALKQEIVARRRDLHKHPESAWTEFRTASIVAQELTDLGYGVHCVEVYETPNNCAVYEEE